MFASAYDPYKGNWSTSGTVEIKFCKLSCNLKFTWTAGIN